MNGYQRDVAACLAELKSSWAGLDEEEARRRLAEYGLNKLAEEKKFSALKLLASQFTSFLVLVLIGAGILSLALGDAIDAIAILAIVVLNGALGFFQEFKAEKALAALKRMSALNARVLRGERFKEVDAETLVPGDIVVLEAGTKVPADLRLLETVSLKIDEASLTGESSAVTKRSGVLEGEHPLAEQSNMAFANTVVTYGKGKGVVVGTGMQTEFGKIAGMITEMEEEKTPLQRKLEVLAKQLSLAIGVVILAVFAVGLAMGDNPFEMFAVAVSLGVAAIPEGLPAVITIALAIGVTQMAKRNALVRRMPAVEALGSATVICSDKTGTITSNEMTVERVWVGGTIAGVSGRGYALKGEFHVNGARIGVRGVAGLDRLLEIAVHCNDAYLEEVDGKEVVRGDPTEAALTVLATKGGARSVYKRVDEVPFSSERKMMSTVHEMPVHGGGSKQVVFAKGAPSVILEKCSRQLVGGIETGFSAAEREAAERQGEAFAGQGFRVLALAYKEADGSNYEENLVWVGLAAMNDPPRAGVKEAVALCSKAGIKLKMITGDNPLTAKAIAERVGFPNAKALTGKDLDGLGKEEFERVVVETGIFARVSPEHKYRIVDMLRKRGEVVAVTGDGVNDAPALKNADIGVAMGIKGTDVAKEASDMVLRDDNFATIVSAVKEGRRIYANIKNFVRYLLAANFGEVIIVSLATFARMPLPLLPIQILWLNLVTDSLPALALSSEPAERGEMERPPHKPGEKILKPMLPFLVLTALLSTGIVFYAFGVGWAADAAAGVDVNDHDVASKMRTLAFTSLVMFELVFVFSCRAEEKGVLDLNPFSNKWLWVAALVSVGLQLLAVYHPLLQVFMRTVPLSLGDWGLVMGLALSSAAVPYLARWLNAVIQRR